MKAFDVHVLIEQGLQNIGAFAYADMLREELDLQFNTQQPLYIDQIFKGIQQRQGKPGFQDTIKRLDDIREIQVKDEVLSVIAFTDGFSASLPTSSTASGEYSHLVNDRSTITYSCSGLVIEAGDEDIVVGNTYTVLKGTLTYNSIQVSKDGTFVGVDGQTSFTSGSGGTANLTTVVEKVDNELKDQEELHRILEHPFGKTRRSRPISNISNDTIYVYTAKSDKPFTVNNIIIDYVKVAQKLDYDPPLTASGSLVVGDDYEVVTLPVTHNGVPMTFIGEIFTATLATYTGGGTIKIARLGDCLLSERVCNKIIDMTVQHIAKITEQDQRKIGNLKEETIE